MGEALYRQWVADGSPFTLVRPLRHLRDLLRGYGYTVYDRGNRDHLLHDPPEDHTPYSATGWPNTARYGYGYAVDIMPPGAGSKLPSLQQLGRQLYADRAAGDIKWLKYINWEPDGNYTGPCYHDAWQPDHTRRSSSDRGHIHVSARTGYEESTAGDGYDPVAVIRGEDMAAFTDAHAATLTALGKALPALTAQAAYADARLEALAAGRDTVRSDLRGAGSPVWLVTAVKQLAAQLGVDQVDEQQVAQLVVQQLGTLDVAAAADALRAAFGDRVDELAAALVAPGS